MRRRQQRGSIVRIGERWYMRYWESIPENGVLVRKRKTHCLGPVTTKGKHPPADIVDEGRKFMVNTVNDSSIPAEHSITLKQFVEEVFLPWAKLYKRASTYKAYSDAWNYHLKAVAGRETKSLKEIQTFTVQAWLEKIAQQKMARHSLQHIKSTLSGIFKQAIRLQYRKDGNPVRDAELPPTPEPAEMHAYTLEEEQAILSLLPEPAGTAFAVACYTGLRIGEITGLNWEDFADSELRVCRSIWSGIANEPKTRKSKASVPVIRQLAERLELHRLRCGNPQTGAMFKNYLKERMNLPNLVHNSILPALNRCAVCGGEEGKAHLKQTHDFKRDERIPVWHGWHAARRGLGSNLYRMGVPSKVIQRILRHSKVATTEAFYIITDNQEVRDAMASFEHNLDSKISVESQSDTQRTLTADTDSGSGSVN
jgi:integrase